MDSTNFPIAHQVMIAGSFSGNNSSNNCSTGYITNIHVPTHYESRENDRITHWLSPLEPDDRHHSVRANRLDSVGDWLLKTSEFQKWRDGDSGADEAILFCHGDPGVGKTYLSSLVIDSLLDQARKGDIAVAGLYYDFHSQQEQTTTNMIGAILKQLVVRGDIRWDIRRVFQMAKEEIGGRGPRLPDMVKLLRRVLDLLPQVFICIDALDECLPRYLQELLESLSDIVREYPQTRIFLTGRPHIKDGVQRYFPTAAVMPITPKVEDIRNYLEMRLDRDDEPEAMDNDLRANIMRKVPENKSNTFLLIVLHIDAILGEVTIGRRRKKLKEMARGGGLSDAYTVTLARVKGQMRAKSRLGMTVLMWVAYSERALRVEELCHAVAVEVGAADLDPDDAPTLRTLLGCCLGLVTVEESSSTVRLVHFTLQQHLLSDPTLSHSPHSSIAEVCLTYLNFECLWDPSPTLDSAPPAMALQEYASCYWGKHASRGMTENVETLALKLFNRRATLFGLQIVG